MLLVLCLFGKEMCVFFTVADTKFQVGSSFQCHLAHMARKFSTFGVGKMCAVPMLALRK